MKKIFIIIGIILILSTLVIAAKPLLTGQEKQILKDYLAEHYDLHLYKINNIEYSSKIIIYEIELKNKQTNELTNITWIKNG